jgi:hypothetical protein
VREAQKELGDMGRDVAGLLSVHVRAGSAAVVGRTELTGRVHGTEARARGGKRHNADGSGPRHTERERAGLVRLAPIVGSTGQMERGGRAGPTGPKGQGRGGSGYFSVFLLL